jgi:DNA-binding NtrC family response regulator
MKVYTLLIVDDEPSLLHSMQRALRQEPYRILLAENGFQALAILEQHDVDVVVSDYRMPAMDGLELLKRIREAYPHILLIMLTAYPDVETILQAINEVGMFKFLLKPIRLILFKQAVAAALQRVKTQHDRRASNADSDRDTLLAELERDYPGITTLPPRDERGYFIIEA